MYELALFAGAGGGLLGSRLLGWNTVCAVEISDYCRKVLLSRQRDGQLEPFPIWDDVRTFDGNPWHGRVDVISGGFPCQDISTAGKRAGIDGPKSGLWREFARIIEEVSPTWVFIENSPNLRGNGLVRVLKDLARMGYDAEWGVFSGKDVGAPHLRKRMWIVAHTNNHWERTVASNDEMARTRETSSCGPGTQKSLCASESGENYWRPVDIIQGVDDGVAHRMDRIRATGNGQISVVAALAFTTLAARFHARQA